MIPPLRFRTASLIAIATGQALATPGAGLWLDPRGDAALRPTDLGADGPTGPAFTPIDLLSVRLRGWLPHQPSADPYDGKSITTPADLFRMDIELDGVVSPPGPLGLAGFQYDPYRYGDRPLFGFIDLDIDDRKNSGGELMPLAANRYLANVGRFGLSPSGSISQRMVRSPGDADTAYWTSPQFERTGAEFALALCGCTSPVIVSQDGNQDDRFDAGETWIVRGRFFERFQAFEPESALFGGSDFGLWDPIVELRFSHELHSDITTVTLVGAITNLGAALLDDRPEQPIDRSLLNHTSILEALDDLIEGADYTDGPLEDLAEAWEDRDPQDYRKPHEWAVSALIGTAYATKQPGAVFVWTDTGFDETFGDLDDDDDLTPLDAAVITEAIASEDGGPSDQDGATDGRVSIPDYGPSFDLRDLNGDGGIDLLDRWEIACPADIAVPYGVLNAFDVMRFIELYNAQSQLADLVDDDLFNIFDFLEYMSLYNAGCPENRPEARNGP